jgi:hypothetical protein
MASSGQNEGFRVLEEFACEAIPAPDRALPSPAGRGVNTGMEVVTELVVRASGTLSKERIAALRAMSSAQLLALLRSSGSALSNQELLTIHDIAAERWTNGDALMSQAAVELSREAMLVATNRTT